MCIGELGTVQIYASPIFEYQGLAVMGREVGGTILLDGDRAASIIHLSA